MSMPLSKRYLTAKSLFLHLSGNNRGCCFFSFIIGFGMVIAPLPVIVSTALISIIIADSIEIVKRDRVWEREIVF